MGSRSGDILFLLASAAAVLASYWMIGVRGLALATLAFFLPLYPIRLAVWLSWKRLRPWLAARWSPLHWYVFAFGTWGFLAIIVWIVASKTMAPLRLDLPAWLRLLGIVVLAGGLALGGWAQWLLGLRRAILTTAIFGNEKEESVIGHGPYAFVPHPLFLGEWLVIAGCSLATSEIWLLAILVLGIPIDLFAAKSEERDLEERLGDTYVAYRSRFRYRRRSDDLDNPT